MRSILFAISLTIVLASAAPAEDESPEAKEVVEVVDVALKIREALERAENPEEFCTSALKTFLDETKIEQYRESHPMKVNFIVYVREQKDELCKDYVKTKAPIKEPKVKKFLRKVREKIDDTAFRFERYHNKIRYEYYQKTNSH